MSHKKTGPYLHGFSEKEQDRLWFQGEIFENTIYQDIDFTQCKHVLEIGSGVGAQTSILLRRFPKIQVTAVEFNEAQIKAAEKKLSQIPYAQGRFHIKQMDATKLDFDSRIFDGAFLCWVLEHVKKPERVLAELRNVLIPGSPVYITEVMNSSFFLDPYSPNIWKYWMAFNDFQYESAGDPFIGAKLGNLLLSQGYKDIRTEIKNWHFDNRKPMLRKQAIRFWKDLLLSASDHLLQENVVDQKTVDAMKEEFVQVESDPNAVFFYAFVQATAIV